MELVYIPDSIVGKAALIKHAEKVYGSDIVIINSKEAGFLRGMVENEIALMVEKYSSDEEGLEKLRILNSLYRKFTGLDHEVWGTLRGKA